MLNSYYKKIDRSMMDWGFTVPQDYIKVFEASKPVKLGSSRKIFIFWDKKKYEAKICHVNRKKYKSVYQIRWDSNRELLNKIRKTFIQSYIILKSQKELFDLSEKGKHFRTQLSGGQQEVIVFKVISRDNIEAKTFIKIDNGWNDLFERLADENVFGWLFDKNKKYLISRSTNWIKSRNFREHSNSINVIYYLVHSKKKLLYVGKAENLGKRVFPGKLHQNMPSDWDLFRYDIVKPEYANILERIEDHTIRAFAAVLKNNRHYPTLNLGGYTLVNSNWKKL